MHDDLCRNVFKDRIFNYPARVVFRFPLTATDDPRVLEYRPGIPAKLFAPTIRIEFTDPPSLMTSPTVVLGTVDRIIPDLQPRASRHLGVVVLTSCRAEPSTP